MECKVKVTENTLSFQRIHALKYYLVFFYEIKFVCKEAESKN